MNIKNIKPRKLLWGVSGCGRFAETSFIPAMSLVHKSKITALFSHEKNRAKSLADKFGIANFYNSYEEFLSSDIDCVYVSSSNNNHFEQVIKAAKAGKHILCEKPLALTSAQALEMVKVCEDNNVQLAVNYVHRFHPLVVKAKEIIKSRMIGKLVNINLSFNVDYPPGGNFRFTKSLSGGGALRDIGTHMIDLLRFFGGEIENVQGTLDNIIYKSEVDDFAAALVKFKESGYGYFNVSFNNKRAFNRVEILGHQGAISIEKLIASRFVPTKLTILLEGEAKKAFRKRANKQVHLLKSIQDSFLKNETPMVTGMDGYINMLHMEELEIYGK
ncbi:MAG: dehydrogenase [Ignavibacteria bacterium CG2_30_36_16]|nr:Gfo/Idh/MocA family oxidoreductase [Ignavibacteria bacterium]OIP56079.1 MAG: dehydrogenase [Ignavibacteria bacterium CG2_30_36_16]PJA99471.1 MAG: gfo/Idh/MocA family oxidoreductase [Ignavibacteria bacterium CG_4_9_14_3_um_filter_36_18]